MVLVKILSLSIIMLVPVRLLIFCFLVVTIMLRLITVVYLVFTFHLRLLILPVIVFYILVLAVLSREALVLVTMDIMCGACSANFTTSVKQFTITSTTVYHKHGVGG